MAVFNPTGGKYALATLSAAGTSTVTVSAATFVSGDFGTKQRMVALFTSANVFKGIAWVRQFQSTTALQLENQFVDPVTGLFATQAVGDKLLVSKNLSEIVTTGLTWDAVNRVASMTAAMNVGTSGVETSACIYDENCTIAMTDAIQTTGGVTVFGKLISYDGLTRESMVWNRDVWLNPLSTFQGGGAGTYNYTMLRPNGAGGHFFMFGGNIGGSYQSSNFMGIVGAGTGGSSFAFFGTRQNYGCTSPSNGTTWGANAARHLLYNCYFEATYGNANLIMWGNGTWIGGNITFPQYSAGPLGAFRANGTSNYAAPSGKRALVQDLGQGALIDGIVTSTYNFTNLITPAVNSVRTGSSGASTIVAIFSYQDDYTNVKPRSTIVVRRTVDSVVSTSVVNTASDTFTAKVLQSSYTSTTTGNLNQTANYTSFDWTAKCYGYSVLSGNYAVTNYSLGTGGTGKNMTLGGLINQLADTGVTLTETNALALSSKITINSTTKVITVTANANLDEVYDYVVAWNCSSAANAQVPTLSQYLLTYTGTELTAYTGWTLTVNNAVTLSAGTKFNKIYAPTVTLVGTGQITAVYASTAGTSTIWQFENIQVGTSLAIYDGAGTTKYFQAQVTSAGSYAYYIPPGITGTYNVAVEKYPFKRETATFAANTGGILYFTPSYAEDVGITQTTQATVEAYTELENPSKVYDRTAVFRLTEQGIKIGQIFTRSGTALEVQAGYSHVINKDSSVVYGITGGVITTKSTAYAPDSKYTSELLVPPATLTANSTEIITIAIEDANGNSSIIIAGATAPFDIYKFPITIDYPSGSSDDRLDPAYLVATVTDRIYRFINDPAYNYFVWSAAKRSGDNAPNLIEGQTAFEPMAKGVYTASCYQGAEIQVVEAPEITQINTKVDILQQDINDIKGTGFTTAKQSLVSLRKHVTAQNQA